MHHVHYLSVWSETPEVGVLGRSGARNRGMPRSRSGDLRFAGAAVLIYMMWVRVQPAQHVEEPPRGEAGNRAGAKTVQALMIMNALRCQDRTHTTVIVAPERLIEQWRQECATRAHVEPVTLEYLEEFDGQPRVLLVRPQELGSREFQLAPDTQTLLIVDEPQTMPLDVVDHIALPAVGGRFRQLLLLSATPRLGDPRWRAPILRLLEPELAAAAQLDGVTLDEKLAQREARALGAVGALRGLVADRRGGAGSERLRGGALDQ